MKSNPTRVSDSTKVTVEIDDIIHKSLSSAVVCAVSSHKGKKVDEMPPIRDRIHPEALDTLFESVLADPSVEGTEATFRYDGCQVTISSMGTIRVAPSMNGS